MSKTIFSRIIEGEIPSYKIYENPYVFAFLDIHPIQPGHVLVVPKVEVDSFDELGEPFYTEIFQTAKKIALAQKRAFGCAKSTLSVLGFDVPHVHVHVIPASSMKEVDFSNPKSLSDSEMKEIQSKLIAHLS